MTLLMIVLEGSRVSNDPNTVGGRNGIMAEMESKFTLFLAKISGLQAPRAL